MECHELRPVGERGFYLYRVDHLGNAVKHVVAREHLSPSVHEVDHGSTVAGPLMDPRGQEGDRLRVVQPETALASLPGEVIGGLVRLRWLYASDNHLRSVAAEPLPPGPVTDCAPVTGVC